MRYVVAPDGRGRRIVNCSHSRGIVSCRHNRVGPCPRGRLSCSRRHPRRRSQEPGGKQRSDFATTQLPCNCGLRLSVSTHGHASTIWALEIASPEGSHRPGDPTEVAWTSARATDDLRSPPDGTSARGHWELSFDLSLLQRAQVVLRPDLRWRAEDLRWRARADRGPEVRRKIGRNDTENRGSGDLSCAAARRTRDPGKNWDAPFLGGFCS